MSSVTIAEVARRSGVTAGTVSRILNDGGDDYRPSTRDRVREAAKELGYRPNRLARSLVTGRTHVVAVHLVQLHTQFYARISNALQIELSAHNYQMMFQKLPESASKRADPLPLPSFPVDAEIVVDGGARFAGQSSPAFSEKRPMVSIGVYCLPDVDSVQIDVYSAATAAFEHLTATGRKRIAYVIDAPTLAGTAEPMVRAYRDFMTSLGRTPQFVSPADRSTACIEQQLTRFATSVAPSERPDAMFCHGDIVAHVALRVMRNLGVRVPQEIAIVGCGGGEETEFQSPSLTTIKFPVQQMAERAWKLLEQRIANPGSPPQHVVLRADLVIRESSGPQPATMS